MSALTKDQERYLIERDPTDRALAMCDHERCHDAFHITLIGIATALDGYGVGGDVYASIVMDHIRTLHDVVIKNPNEAAALGLDRLVANGIALCAMAFRHYRDSHPDE